MLPTDKALTVDHDATVKNVLDTMMVHIDHSAVLVTTGDSHIPVGIVTKADMLRAYHQGMDPQTHKIKEVMSKTIETVLDTDTRDKAAEHFEKTQHKNAVVVNKEGHFVGLVTALDVACEVSRDEHAWPWNRESLAQKYKVPSSPKCALKGPNVHTFEQISGAGDL